MSKQTSIRNAVIAQLVALTFCSAIGNAQVTTWKQEHDAAVKELQAKKPDMNVVLTHEEKAVEKAKKAQLKGIEWERCLWNLGTSQRAAKKYDQAEKTLTELIGLQKNGKESELKGDALAELALVKHLKGDYVASEKLYEQAIPIVRRTRKGNTEFKEHAIWGWSDLKVQMGDFTGAVKLKEEALAIRRKIPGFNQTMVAVMLVDLAETGISAGQYAEAVAWGKEAVSIFEKAGSNYRSGLAEACYNVGAAYCRLHNYREGEAYAKRALAIHEKWAGKREPIVAQDLRLLAECSTKPSEEEKLFKQALSIYKEKKMDNTSAMATLLSSYGLFLVEQKRYAEGEKALEESLRIREKIFGANDVIVGSSLRNLAQVYGWQKKYKESEATFDKCYAVFKKSGQADHPWLGACYYSQGKVFEAQKRYAEAEKLYGKALGIYAKTLRKESQHIKEARESIARVVALKNGSKSKS